MAIRMTNSFETKCGKCGRPLKVESERLNSQFSCVYCGSSIGSLDKINRQIGKAATNEAEKKLVKALKKVSGNSKIFKIK